MSVKCPRGSRFRNRTQRSPGPSAGESYPKLNWVGYELDSPSNLIRFMRQLIKDGYTSGLGPRQIGALNTAVRNLMQAYGMTDFKLKEMEQRIAALEKVHRAGNPPTPS
jgi:hypothetical protein